MREQPQQGTHMARLLSVTDLGHQPGFVYQGKEIDAAWKLEFTYELVNHKMEDGRPFVVSEELTNKDWEDQKTGRASTLVARAKSLLNENYRRGMEDLSALLGAPCMVSVVLNDSGYAKVKGQAAVGSIPMGMDVPALTNAVSAFSMDDPDMDAFEAMPEFKQNKLKAALNYNETQLAKALAESGEY